MFLHESINFIFLIIDSLLKFPLPKPYISCKFVTLILFVGQLFLQMLDPGAILFALHGQFIFQSLDSLCFITTCLQDIVLHTRQLFPKGTILCLANL